VLDAQLEALELIADGPDEPVEAGPHRRVRPAADARARRAHLDAARNLVLVRQLLHIQVLHDLTLVHGVRHLLLVRQSTQSTPKFSLAKKKKQGWLQPIRTAPKLVPIWCAFFLVDFLLGFV